MCHTSLIFTPAFPWHQMRDKFSCRLVSTLSYLLYTCQCQEFMKQFIFFQHAHVECCVLEFIDCIDSDVDVPP